MREWVGNLAVFLLATLYLVLSIATAYAEDPLTFLKKNSKYTPTVNLEYKAGTERNVGRGHLLVPLVQNSDNLFFTDINATLRESDDQEYNFGLGFRKIVNNRFIVGVYGFYDLLHKDNNEVQQHIMDGDTHKRSISGKSTFDQVTFGAEILTANWDFRANYYYPMDDYKVVGQGDKTGIVRGNDILIDQDILHVTYSGFDVEVGRKLPFYDKASLFVAYYDFDSEASKSVTSSAIEDASGFSGYRVRGELQLLDTDKMNIELNAEYSDDDLRDDNLFVGLNIGFKFGGKDKQIAKTSLEKRMTNKIVRDIDVVTQVIVPERKVALDEYGRKQKIYFVAPGSDRHGDGTEGNPFSLEEAVTSGKVGEGAIIYLTEGNYDMTHNIKLQDFQKLYGVGTDLVVNNVRVRAGSTSRKSRINFLCGDSNCYSDPYTTNIEQPDFGKNDSDRGDDAYRYTGVLADIVLANNNVVGGLHIFDNVKGMETYAIFGHNVHNAQIINNTIETGYMGVGFQYDQAGNYSHVVNNNYVGQPGAAERGAVKVLAHGEGVQVSSEILNNHFGEVSKFDVSELAEQNDMKYYQSTLAIIAENSAKIRAKVLGNTLGSSSGFARVIAKNQGMVNLDMANNNINELYTIKAGQAVDGFGVSLEGDADGLIQGNIANNTVNSMVNSGVADFVLKDGNVKATVNSNHNVIKALLGHSSLY